MQDESSVYNVESLTELALTFGRRYYTLQQQKKIKESNEMLKPLLYAYWMNFNMGNKDSVFGLYKWFKKGFDDVAPKLDIAHIFFGVARKLGNQKCGNESVSESALENLKAQIDETYNRFKIAHDTIQNRAMIGTSVGFLLAKYYVCIVLPSGKSLAEEMLFATSPESVEYFANDVSQFSPQTILYYLLGDAKCMPKAKQALDDLLNDNAQDDVHGYQSSANVIGESTTGYGTGTAADNYAGDNNPGCCCILM